MNGIILLETFGVLVCWAALAHVIWKWGPGLRRRSVQCPEKQRPAQVVADQREAEFNCLRVVGVSDCSLVGNLPCSKGCMTQL